MKLEWDIPFSSLGDCQCIWYNKNIHSKSKQYFLYQDWLDKGIIFISDLLNPPHPGGKLFEELVLDFHISLQDRRKYNVLMKNIPEDWLGLSDLTPSTIFDEMRAKLFSTKKIPKYAYSVILDSCIPERQIVFWRNVHDPDQKNWGKNPCQ